MAKGLGTTLTKIPTSSITDSTITLANLVTSGTASSSTFLKGDLSWGTVSVEGKINVVDSDPAVDTAGDIWYTGGRFKFVSDPSALGAVWTSGGNLNVAKKGQTGAGNLDAGMCIGGGNASGNLLTSEIYNGINWATSGNINTARSGSGSAGTTSAAVVFGGPSMTDSTEEYNGATWTTVNTLPAGRTAAPACGGTQTSCYATGGTMGSPAVPTDDTVEYDGTCWSGGGTLPAVRRSMFKCGVGKVSAGLAYMGSTHDPAPNDYQYNTYEYDGTSWTTGNNGAIKRGQMSGAGTQGAAVAAGGWLSPSEQWSAYTEEYDGTCWSTANNLITATYDVCGGGSISGAYIAGGEKGSNVYANETQEYRRAIMKFIGT